MLQKIRDIWQKRGLKIVLRIQNSNHQGDWLFAMSKPMITIGASNHNDLILKGNNILPREGFLLIKKGNIVFTDIEGRSTHLLKKGLKLGSFQLSVVQWKKWLLIPLALLVLSAFVGSAEPVTMSQIAHFELPARSIYGNLLDGKSKYHRLHFSFSIDEVQPLVLKLTSGNILTKDDLKILINDHEIDRVDPCPDCWNREQRIVFEEKYLKAGVNTVAFVYQGNPQHVWAVKNLYVEQTQFDQIYTVEQLYNISKKLFIERGVKAGNLLRSKKMLERLLKGLENQKQEIPLEVIGLQEKIQQALLHQQKQLLREARIMVRNKNWHQAKIYYERLLDEYIDPVDPVRNQILMEIEEVGL